MKKVLMSLLILLWLSFWLSTTQAVAITDCPMASPPYCEHGYEILDSKTVNWCEIAQYKCNDWPKICTKEYMPVCGQVKQNCSTTWNTWNCTQSYSLPTTYGNKCEMEAAGATLLYDWKCSDSKICPIVSPPYCEYGFETLDSKTVNWCEIPQFKCNDWPKICTNEYMPVCGQVKQNCSTTWNTWNCTQSYSLPTTYGNKCEMEAAGATLLYDWKCSDTNMCPELSPPANIETGCNFVIVKNYGVCDTAKIVCESDILSFQLKKRSDQVLKTFEKRLKKLNITQEQRLEIIDKVILKLEKISWPNKTKTVNALVKYLVKSLTTLRIELEDDVDSVFDILQ